MRQIIFSIVCFAPLAAMGCNYPDEGTMPLRRAVTRIQLLPETQAWATYMQKTGAVVQYALLLEHSIKEAGRCYWTVEVGAGGKLWRRYYVTPDGKRVLTEDGRQAAATPPAATRSAGSTAAAR